LSLTKKESDATVELDKIQVVEDDARCPLLRIVEGDGVARAVIWPGMGASARSMHRITLGPGACTKSVNHSMEAVYYVISGNVLIKDETDGASVRLRPGSMAFVEPNTPYVLAAIDDRVEIVGGPCPPDHSLYEHLTT
jgi:mannose-6-phosphate isomerase-like protein (cupin superfamily)